VFDRLVVADIDEDGVVKRDRRSVLAGNEEPRSIHEHEEPDRLENDRLSPGVRTGDDERLEPVLADKIERRDGPSRPLVGEALLEQRMARAPQDEPAVSAVLGHDAAESPREERLRGNDVEIEEQILIGEERVPPRHHVRGELEENPRRLVPLLLKHRLETVVLVDELERLHEEGGAASARLVNDTPDAARLPARQRHDVPLAADRHKLVPLAPADAAREFGHGAAQPAPERCELPAQPRERLARAIEDLEIGPDGPLDASQKIALYRERFPASRKKREELLMSLQETARLRGARLGARDDRELFAREEMPLGFRRAQEPMAVAPPGERRALAAVHQPHELDRLFLHPDGPFERRGGAQRAYRALRPIGERKARHELENGRELELLGGMREIFAHRGIPPCAVRFFHAG
jgi:hypothetical protein